jgi:hypothetical protein
VNCGGSGEWRIPTYGGRAEDCGHESHEGLLFHDYFEWSMGGSKYYKVTDGVRPVVHDLRNYTAEDAANDGNIQMTPDAAIIHIDEYLGYEDEDRLDFVGWIYDDDGYAYWSRMLGEGEATGLLLNRVGTSQTLENEDYYYAINVMMEAVDRKDAPMWLDGSESVDHAGEFHERATEKGAELISFILDNAPDEAADGDDPTAFIGIGEEDEGELEEEIDEGLETDGVEGVEIDETDGIETDGTVGAETGETEGIETDGTEGAETGETEGIETDGKEGAEAGETEGIETGGIEDVEGAEAGETEGSETEGIKTDGKESVEGAVAGETEGSETEGIKTDGKENVEGAVAGETDGIKTVETEDAETGETEE